MGKQTSLSSLLDTREPTFVCCLTAVYLCLACFWQNISLYDESFYLDSGNHIHASTFIHGLQSSPLYGLWFRILTRFFPDALDRYFASDLMNRSTWIRETISMRARSFMACSLLRCTVSGSGYLHASFRMHWIAILLPI